MRRTMFRAPVLLALALAACAPGGLPGLGESRDAAARLRLVATAEAAEQYDVALAIMRPLAASAPDNAEWQARFARVLLRTGQVNDADATLAQALRRRPGDATLLRQFGQVKLLMDKPAEALDAFEAVLRRTPADVVALNGRGVALDLRERHAEAQASYRAALEVDPQNLAASNNLALSVALAGRPAEAVAAFEALLRRTDAPERVRNNLQAVRLAVRDPGLLSAGP